MKGLPRHERRWASDTVTVAATREISSQSSPASSCSGSDGAAGAEEELVEVTLDFQDDDTIVLRSVEPASATDFDHHHLHDIFFGGSGASTPASTSRSPTVRRSSSHRLRQFSQELKAEAVARARQFSQELKAEMRRFSRSHGHASSRSFASSSPPTQADSRLAARALRRQRAQLDRTRSGAQKALRGLRFISKTAAAATGGDAWNEIQNNFNKLAKDDGFLHREDFAQCIGMKDSKEFALELFDALSRRRRLKADKISKDELQEFWLQITDKSFDSRLQIFFDMYVYLVSTVDKNEDGRITEAEVKE
ncbi:hypothetical protein ACLOJK_041379, partial [Asimina triloba]